MAQRAPEIPTAEQLNYFHPLTREAEIEITLARGRVGDISSLRQNGLVAVVGPCAMTAASDIIRAEGRRLVEVTRNKKGLYVVHRMPPWKPRTRAEDWHGLETDDPEGHGATLAHQTIIKQANSLDAVAIEVANMDHMRRYGAALTLGWFGGRTTEKTDKIDMMRKVVEEWPELPFAVKNGLDGDIVPTLKLVRELNDIRGEDNAPVVLLYRGGANATNPEAWEYEYRRALDMTDGAVMVDVAHGSEMAHDPSGNFKKSVAGQEAALQHVVTIAEEHGEMPSGIMAEASGAESPTDPHMPLEIALQGVVRVHELRMRRESASVGV